MNARVCKNKTCDLVINFFNEVNLQFTLENLNPDVMIIQFF
jgi:hypothetical protein